jgi:anaerobic dimethyl sulfoxide reductase subunit B (iron-sulfur subunit)
MEHGLPVGQYGIKISELGPWEYKPEVWQFSYVPMPTDQCNLCEQRTPLGKQPTCVSHCQAKCMEYGLVNELAKKLTDHPKQVLFAL